MNERMDFDTFQRDWLKRHKGSIVNRPRISSWGLIGGIFIWAVIALGAAVVSGAHSVPAILQTIPAIVMSPMRETLSLFGFTIFELLIFAGALYRRQTKFATLGLILSLVGALAANIGSSVFSVHENNGQTLDYIVAVILALIAPLAAFLAGEMVQRLFEQHAADIKTKMDAYDAARRELDKVINREFVKYEKLHEAARKADEKSVKKSLHEISRNPFMNDGENLDFTDFSPDDFMNVHEALPPRETSRNFVKPRVKLNEIAAQVLANEDADLSTNEMMAKYNISLGSTTKIRTMLKSSSDNQLMQ
jgi:hypothetical protein